MEIKELLGDAKNLTDFQFEQRLNKLVREDPRFHNLDEGNRKVVLELVKKYKSNLRKGIGITYDQLKREGYDLYQKRLAKNLTAEDIKDIKEILAIFKK